MPKESTHTSPARDDRLVVGVTEPQHYQHATEREMRAQSVHRLQLGLSGLCTMLLIVGLANIIMDRAQTVEAQVEQVIAVDDPQAKPAVDPLADAGVTPAADPTEAPDSQTDPARQGGR